MITHIFFDVDGTLYNKTESKDQKYGSIQNAQDLIRFRAFELLLKGEKNIETKIIEEYKKELKSETLSTIKKRISNTTISNYEFLLSTYGSNGKVFVNRFKKDSAFLHKILSKINYEKHLKPNPNLGQAINILSKNYKLGILTTESYDTIKKVFPILGLSISSFEFDNYPTSLYSKKGTYYPILCAENIENKKPSPEGFKKIIKLAQTKPENIMYVGDSLIKDIYPALEQRMKACHITPQPKKNKAYLQISTISKLPNSLN